MGERDERERGADQREEGERDQTETGISEPHEFRGITVT